MALEIQRTAGNQAMVGLVQDAVQRAPDPPAPAVSQTIDYIEYTQDLAGLRTQADEEIAEAEEAGYEATALKLVSLEASRLCNKAAPHLGTSQSISPAEEKWFNEWSKGALETIRDMRERRAADMGRARRAEADALRAVAERQLHEFQEQVAIKRHAAFMAGAPDELTKIHEAMEDVVSSIEDVKKAAEIITSKVEKINKVLEFAGKKTIKIPELPKGITDVTSWLEKANSKLAKAKDLLGLLRPGQTELEDGIKYLEGANMAIEHFGAGSANPFVSGYVTKYLSPGIKNCVQSLRTIGKIEESANIGAITQARPDLVNWAVEPGDSSANAEALYGFMVLVFRRGAAAPISNSVHGYMLRHDKDLSAAAGASLPEDRDAMVAWVSAHRHELWQAFYANAREPYVAEGH